MAVYDKEKVVVERDDAASSNSPIGWIIALIVVLLALTFFMMLGGTELFTGDNAQEATTPVEDTAPIDTNTDPDVDDTQNTEADPTVLPTPDEQTPNQ